MIQRKALLLFACLLSAGNAVARPSVDYVRDVKPILKKRCVACHGPLQQKAKLRLDTATLIRKGGRKGPVIVPGNAKTSRLIEKVNAPESERMPPEGKPLTEVEIATLTAWIDQGAKAPNDEVALEDPTKHWSYQKPVRPSIPDLQSEWARNPIDHFIAAKHRKHKLIPRPSAKKEVLLRRVYLDLTGVPPTRGELHEFLNDKSPDAFDRVVDRLLDSPKHGERWGRHWMDVWRYSDWYGRRQQNEIRYSQYHVWRWRDWIIESVNEDKGYDRMILEMLAGDELEPANPKTLVATSFIGRNWYKFDRDVWMRDTVEHTAMGLLALTLKCARCHDHKYDPILQKDYYRFRAFFEPHDARVDPIAGQADVKKDGIPRVYDKDPNAPTYLFVRGDDRYPDKDHPLTSGIPGAFSLELPKITPVSIPVESWYPALRPDNVARMIADAKGKIESANSNVVKTKQQAQEARRQLESFDESKPMTENSTAFVTDEFSKPQPDVWNKIHGQWEYAKNGKLLETQVTDWAMIATQTNQPADFHAHVRYVTKGGGTYHSVGIAFDLTKNERDFQAVYTSARGKSVQAFYRKNGTETYPSNAIIPAPAVQMNKEVVLDVAVRGSLLNVWVNGQLKIVHRMPLARTIGRFALWVHSGTAEFDEAHVVPLLPSVVLAKSVKERINVPSAKLTKADLQRIVAMGALKLKLAERKVDVARAELAALRARIAAERAKYAVPPDPNAAKLAQAAIDAERQLAEAAGEVPKKAKSYAPLGKAAYPKTSTGRRLALARWIADGDNPRTARVLVNHVWLRHFGKALVPSVSNFGLAGKDPTHPELLDWLAVELVKHDWSMKWLHRMIVTSSTYHVASSPDDHNRSIDPENKYLWRMNYRRMEAELVRDCVLHVAGRLDTTMGGPELTQDLGETSHRRSLYFRTTPDDKMQLLELFDLANPNQCYERKHSVVPQQSLALMNSAMILTQARLLARSLSKDVKADDAFITAAFEQTLSRTPSDRERRRCASFLKEQVKLLRDSKNLSGFPSASTSAIAPSGDPVLRARENLIHVLLNHNDFVTIR